MGVGDVEVDLSAAVRSLQYNLGPGFGRAFLTAYGRPDATDRDVDRLWSMYGPSRLAATSRFRPHRPAGHKRFLRHFS